MNTPNRLLLGLAIVAALAACSKTDAPAPAGDTAPATTDAASTPPAETSASTSALPAIVSLDDTQRAETVTAAKACNLESVDGQSFSGADIALAMPKQAKAGGWLLAEGADAVETPALRIESADKSQVWEVPVQLTLARDDLSLENATAATPGFEVAFDASGLKAGRYHLYLAYRSAGALMGCDNGRWISIP